MLHCNLKGDLRMKQSEKKKRSCDFILMHAFAEFAEHGYTNSSLNQICARGSISKGLLYHYYSNKNALYLACVAVLFRDMTNALQKQIDLTNITVDQYFSVRMRFFQQYPLHRQLFYDVLLYPQSFLAEQIGEYRQDFDHFNNQVLRSILQKDKLTDSVSLDNAITQFRAFVNFLGVYIREDSAKDAEQKTNELLHTMLYGLIAR